MNLKHLHLFSLALLAGACATTHNLTPLGLETPPMVELREGSKADAPEHVTFSVFPPRIAKSNAALTGADLETSALFSLRCAFEARGYRFVPIDESPDLLVTVDAVSSLLGKFDPANPPKPGTIQGLTDPALVAGGAFDPLARKSIAAYEFGALPPGYGAKELLPGIIPVMLGRKPRPVFYGTRVTVAVLDNATLSEIWTAAGTGVSRVHDLKVNFQSVLWAMLDRYPHAATTRLHAQTAEIGGLTIEMATTDGAGYFPAILDIDKGAPAWRAGLKPFDVILAIGGEETKNNTLEEVRKKLEGPKGSEVYLTLWRKRVADQFANPLEFLFRRNEHKDDHWMQVNCSITREITELLPKPKTKTQGAVYHRPYFEIPYKVQEGARMCILPAVGCAVIGVIISTAVAAGG